MSSTAAAPQAMGDPRAGAETPSLLSLSDDLLRRVVAACAAQERQTGERSHVGLACHRLWQLFAAERFGSARIMVLDASSLQAPGAGQPGSRAGPDAEAGWRSMRAAVAAYAPGVTALRLARFDLHSRATARKQAELLALLAPRVQRVELRGCAIDAPLLTLLASWPAQQRVAIAGSCNWAKVAAAGTLQQMHGKISSLETAAADVAAVLPQLPALSRLAVDCQEAHLGGPPLLDVAGVLPELTALECVSLHGAATWAAEQHEFEGLVGALCELPRLQECSLSPLNGAALPASLAQLAGALTRLHLDCSGHAYTAADAERLRPGYAALWRLRACQELTLEDARAFMWPPAPAAVDLPVLRTLRLRRGDMPRDLLPPALFDAAALPALERLAVDMELSWQEAEEEEIGPAVGLPPCFASLTTLAHLELASCGLDEVPAEVLLLRLRSLSLRDNPLAHLPPGPPAAAGEGGEAGEPWAWARRLRALNLADTHVDSDSLPPWLAAVLQ